MPHNRALVRQDMEMTETSPESPLLEVTDLAVGFQTMDGPVQAVRKAGFSLGAGKTLAIVGESGSGKSTTAMAVIGLLPGNGKISSGSIRFDGRELVGLPESKMRAIRGRSIGLVPQDPMSNLNPVTKIGTQVAETLLVHGMATSRDVDRKVIEVLTAAGLPDAAERAKQYPHEFSGGMRQRVMIAMALAGDPKLIIADEPTTALDVTIQAQILELLKDIQKKTGCAIMFITHDLGVIAEMADEVVVMYAGKVIEKGTVSEIFKNPKTDSGMKKSLKGLLQVYHEDGVYKVKDQVSKEEEQQGCLRTIFKDGMLYKTEFLDEIRQRVNQTIHV